MEVKRAGDVCCGRKKYWKKQQRQNRRWVESRLQEDPGGKSDLNHHFTGFHSSVQKTPALKGKWFLCHIFCWDFATALVINSWVKSSDTAHFFLLSFSWVQCIQVVFLTFICYPAYLWLMFPLDPSTPIRICSVVVGGPNFLPAFFRVKTFPRPRSAALTHLQMRRSFFSGFLTKMELKRWKTHRPSHSLCKQREWSEDKAVAK